MPTKWASFPSTSYRKEAYDPSSFVIGKFMDIRCPTNALRKFLQVLYGYKKGGTHKHVPISVVYSNEL